MIRHMIKEAITGKHELSRHAYGEGREYVPLALRSQELWEGLERKSHLKIFTQAGAMGFGPQGNAPFIDEAIASGKEHNLHIDFLSSAEIKERFPGLNLPDDYIGFYEANSGFLFSENCIAAYKELAIHHGAETSFQNPVIDIETSDRSVSVITENATFTGDKLIISAGAWSGTLSEKIGLKLPLKTTRQPIGWFEANEALFNLHNFPTFAAEVAINGSKALYYGFPSFGGCGLKIGRHDYEDVIDPSTMNREFGSDIHDEGHLREFLDTFMPEAAGKLKKAAICIYTRTPDGHFIIDQHPEHAHVLIATGFSSHGFKFASVVGEILSQLAMHGVTEHDISLFKLARFADCHIKKE
ncbi:N-methyl-L-tryptophan oxidase [Oceanobacillus indicireducens]|uniref:N-methyl-L-tryptophan oxidase n=1 Tax=Oceanobacillus indicireducens TaxID=1004261 RepID=UPI0027E42CC4|nr:N-methyl-L-tryptophan oxidase [Oceanobacillus indicireducens]